MAKKVKEEKPEVTRAELEALATEMNEVMGLDPKIKFNRKTSDDELLEAIKENATDPDSGEPAIYDTDFEEDPEDPEKVVFSEDAEKTIEALGIEIGEEPANDEVEAEPEPEEKRKGKDAAKGKKAAKEEEPEEVEEKPAKKGAKKEKVEEKPAPKGKAEKGAKAAPKEEKAKAAPKEKRRAGRRVDIFSDFIKDGKKHTHEECIKHMLKEFGGTPKEAKAQLGHYLDLLRNVGAITEKGESFTLTV